MCDIDRQTLRCIGEHRFPWSFVRMAKYTHEASPRTHCFISSAKMARTIWPFLSIQADLPGKDMLQIYL